MLKFLLDENLQPEIVDRILEKRSEIGIVSVHTWRNGQFRGTNDEVLLSEATAFGLTIVTHDIGSIPSLLVRLASVGIDHAGVVFVSKRSRRAFDIGKAVNGLIALWDSEGGSDWTNRSEYLNWPPLR